jgi:hypothetical protein
MRGKIKFAAALFLGAVLCLGAAWAPAEAATQADLEKKIQALEQSLHSLKQQLTEVKTTQDQQAAVAQVAAMDALPKWAQRMKFYGDVRFRYESTSYDEFKGSDKDDRTRFRVRWRFGVVSQIHEDVELGFRLATGSDDDPTSTNQTMGNYWGEITSIGIDRVYIKWSPSFIPNKPAYLAFGKMKNPFFTTKAMFDGDVVPEGLFLGAVFNKKGTVQPFFTGAAFYLKEHKTEPPDDLYAFAGQIGVKAKMNKFKWQIATGYWAWNDFGKEGNIPPNVHGNPVYQENGEDRLSTFGVWDILAKADYKFSKKGSVGFWGHYLTNQQAEGPQEDKDSGYAFGAKLKYAKWSFGAWYKYVEANASPGFIADSDSGFVNRKGWVLEAGYKFFKYGKVKLSYFNTEAIDEDINGAAAGSQTFFADFVFKF